MPLYDFECKNCNYTEEILQGYSDPSVKECPVCHTESFRIVIDNAPHVSCKNYNTIGSLADRNWKNMGHYERDAKIMKDGLDKRKEAQEKREHKNKLSKLNPKQKEKYIYTGEL